METDKSLVLFVILLIIIGCSNLSDKAFQKIINEPISGSLVATQKLRLATSWYYRIHRAWPRSLDDINNFVREQKAPIKLKSYRKIEFLEDDKGNLKCSYFFKKGLRDINVNFSLSAYEALAMNFTIPEFNKQGKFHFKKFENGIVITAFDASEDFNNLTDAHTKILRFTTAWYFKIKGEWPRDTKDLSMFTEEFDWPLDLEEYEEIRFSKIQGDSLACSFLWEENDLVAKGDFTLSKEDMLDNKLTDPELNQSIVKEIKKRSYFFFKSFGPEVEDIKTLNFSVTWFYNNHGYWPQTWDEFTDFVLQHKAPIGTVEYEKLEFTTNADGSLTCFYQLPKDISELHDDLALVIYDEFSGESNFDRNKLHSGTSMESGISENLNIRDISYQSGYSVEPTESRVFGRIRLIENDEEKYSYLNLNEYLDIELFSIWLTGLDSSNLGVKRLTKDGLFSWVVPHGLYKVSSLKWCTYTRCYSMKPEVYFVISDDSNYYYLGTLELKVDTIGTPFSIKNISLEVSVKDEYETDKLLIEN